MGFDARETVHETTYIGTLKVDEIDSFDKANRDGSLS